MWNVLSHKWPTNTKDIDHIPGTTYNNHQKVVIMKTTNAVKYLYDTLTNPSVKYQMPLVS
jgi:hypothetical protein